jgi:hypothetical protein
VGGGGQAIYGFIETPTSGNVEIANCVEKTEDFGRLH